MNSQMHVLDHPILQHKLSYLREARTSSAEFRRILHEMSGLLAYEASRSLALKELAVMTPHGSCNVQRLLQTPIVVAIMRAGNEMLAGVLEVLPQARVGHIGIYRDRVMQHTVEYYSRLPDDIEGRAIFLLDPLLATGDTVLASIDRLQQYKTGSITLLTLLSCQAGFAKIAQFYPAVAVYTLGVADQLNDMGFLLPGLGDVGDRLYGIQNETT